METNSDAVQDLPSGLTLGWSDPANDIDEGRLWLRVSANDITLVRIISADPLHYPGHWFPATRSYRLCTFPNCPFCAAGCQEGGRTRKMASERRIRHLVAVQGHSGEQLIWEFGESVARQIQQITGFERVDGKSSRRKELRGLSLRLCREGSRQAGSVIVCPAPPALPWAEHLPEPIDVAGILALTWRRAALRDGKQQPRLPIGF